MELRATETFPSLEELTALTRELRQLIANELLFRVLDGQPQQKRLATLADPGRFADRTTCGADGCLPALRTALDADLVLGTTISCPDQTHCSITASLQPTGEGTPTAATIQAPRDIGGIRGALRAIAQKLGTPRRDPFTATSPATSAPSTATVTITPDPDRIRRLRTGNIPEDKLLYQNYIIILNGFIGTTIGIRTTWGTLRWEHFQMEILSGGGGVDVITGLEGAHFSCHLIGLGGKWNIASSREHELGFMIGALGGGGTVSRDLFRLEFLPSKFIYRNNMASGGVFEAGIAMPLVWLGSYIPNIQLFVGIGY